MKQMSAFQKKNKQPLNQMEWRENDVTQSQKRYTT